MITDTVLHTEHQTVFDADTTTGTVPGTSLEDYEYVHHSFQFTSTQ